MQIRHLVPVVLLFALVSFRFSVLAQEALENVGSGDNALSEVAELYPTADAHIGSDYSSVNYGHWETMYLGRGVAGVERVLLQFDHTEIPGKPQINNARLRVYVAGSSPPESPAMETNLYQVTSSWRERDVTWGTQPSLGEIEATSILTDNGIWYEWDITDLVARWVQGSAPNYGVELVGEEEEEFERFLYSRERYSFEPRLLVEYEYRYPEPESYLPVVIRPAPTPTITPIPAPIPTPLPGYPSGIQILPNHSDYTTSDGTARAVVGEVFNNTADHVQHVKITANFFSSGQRYLWSEEAYIPLRDLPSGEKTCFLVATSENQNEWAYYTFENPSYATDGHPLPNITILASEGHHESGGGVYRVTGQLRNDSGTSLKNVRVLATFYDAAGTVLGCDFSRHIDLSPGQAGEFGITWSAPNSPEIVAYRLQSSNWISW